jgi:preprotein translocase subunit SecA
MSILDCWYSLSQVFAPYVAEVSARDRRTVTRVQDCAGKLRNLTSLALLERVAQLKAKVAAGAALSSDNVTIDAAAALQTAARRAIGIELYDEQLLAGLVLSRGAVAEMQTGEGKTYAAALPAFVQTLAGKRVHVATPNSYLARRDCELLRPLFETLGVSVGLLPEASSLEAKRAIYDSDVVYGTGYEFGFDFLREQRQLLSARGGLLGTRFRERLRADPFDQPPLELNRQNAFVIVDEIDSVLIDEACLPLILAEAAGAAADDAVAFSDAHDLARTLVASRDYVLDSAARSVRLTEQGAQRIHLIQEASGARRLARPWSDYIQQALHAQWLLRPDIDYIVEGGKVKLVDQYTGRILAERSWSDGLHQAVEIKEGLSPTPEHCSAAQITRQRYFRMYGAMCGMTGTAGVSAREFWELYRLPVVSIPLRKPSRRESWPTRYFADAEAKRTAIVDEVVQVHQLRRPVLIGSRTIENSLLIAERLARTNIPFRLLNGKQTEDEAAIVANSGQAAAVTIATNMAGRGTDIKLESGVEKLGGLHLIGVERHESRRIDDQLRGRVGRQGDPGSCRFFLSAGDDLIARFAPSLVPRFGTLSAGTASPELDAEIEALQARLERRGYAERRRLLTYDRWLDEIRLKFAPG